MKQENITKGILVVVFSIMLVAGVFMTIYEGPVAKSGPVYEPGTDTVKEGEAGAGLEYGAISATGEEHDLANQQEFSLLSGDIFIGDVQISNIYVTVKASYSTDGYLISAEDPLTLNPHITIWDAGAWVYYGSGGDTDKYDFPMSALPDQDTDPEPDPTTSEETTTTKDEPTTTDDTTTDETTTEETETYYSPIAYLRDTGYGDTRERWSSQFSTATQKASASDMTVGRIYLLDQGDGSPFIVPSSYATDIDSFFSSIFQEIWGDPPPTDATDPILVRTYFRAYLDITGKDQSPDGQTTIQSEWSSTSGVTVGFSAGDTESQNNYVGASTFGTKTYLEFIPFILMVGGGGGLFLVLFALPVTKRMRF